MKKIKEKMQAYNDAAYEIYNKDGGYDYYKLLDTVSATDEAIQALENLCGFAIPAELNAFYKEIGRVENTEHHECYCFQISAPSDLVEETMQTFSESYSDRAPSRGLIDVIIASWGFDRPEFQNHGERESGLTEEETRYINEHFKCFGRWLNDDILEGAFYLFFDKKGNIGEVYYHQDNFNDTAKKLKKLLTEGITDNRGLEAILVNALDAAQKTMIEWQ